MEDDIRAKMRASMKKDSSQSNSKSEDTPAHRAAVHRAYTSRPDPNISEPPQDTSLHETNKALERAFKDYRIKCDMALSEREDDVYTQAEYEEAILWELDNAVSFVHEIYSSKVAKLFEQIRSEVIGEEPMLGDKNARIEIYKLQPGQTEVHVPRVDFVTREALREEQLEALTRLEGDNGK